MSLHDRIMALPLVAPYAGRDYEAVELRNHASEIGREADEIMEEMAGALSSMAVELEGTNPGLVADFALTKYFMWKEQNK